MKMTILICSLHCSVIALSAKAQVNWRRARNVHQNNSKNITMKKITLAVIFLTFARGLFAQDCNTCHGSNTLSLTTGVNTSGSLMPMPSTATGGVADPAAAIHSAWRQSI